MSVTLLEITKNTRGKDSHPITFKAIGRYVTKTVNKESQDAEGKTVITPTEVQELATDGVVTSVNDALELVGGNTQALLDMFAIGYNKVSYQQEADKDELDPYVASMDEDQANAFKRAVRATSKALGFSLLETAELLKSAQKSE